MRKHNRWDIDTIDISEGHKVQTEKIKRRNLSCWIKENWRVIIIFISLGYLVFITAGLALTRFYKDENGARQAYKLTIDNLKEKDSYTELKDKLTDIRNLLVDVTVVDIHLSNSDISNYDAATLYTEILNNKLDVLIPKISSLSVSDSLKTVREAMESLLSYDLALYLQNISAALKSGDSNVAQTALSSREKALETYEIIVDYMKDAAERLKIKEKDFYDWKLYDAVIQKDKTAIFKESD